MLYSSAFDTSEHLRLTAAAVENLTVGILVLHEDRVVLANRAVQQILNLTEKVMDSSLTIDGPDGLLRERISENYRPELAITFDYRLPHQHDEKIRTVKVTLNQVEDGL